MTATLSVILICLLLSAFFSGMEIAFLTSNKLRIEIDKSKKGVTQALIDLFISHSGMYITTLLVGNNVVMVIYGIFMSDLLVKQFEFLHLSIGVELFVETLVSTLIILVFAEFLPKTVFRLRSDRGRRSQCSAGGGNARYQTFSECTRFFRSEAEGVYRSPP